jgi:hypothetical protein
MKKLIVQINSLLMARKECQRTGNAWFDEHTRKLHEIEEKYLPHGSGIDAGCKIDMENSTGNKIIINFAFHHMNQAGYYSGWTEHSLICTPTFEGFRMRITGRDKNYVKDYLYDTFDSILNKEIETIP